MTNQILLTLSQSLSGKNGRLLIGVGAISALTICSMLLDNGYSLETPKGSIQAPNNTNIRSIT